MLRTDRGGKFTSVEFTAYYVDQCVVLHHTAPYSPQQNGMVEWQNQTVVGMARSMMKAKGMPARFWGETVTTMVFILNCGPTKALNGKTPFEAWYGCKPSVSFLRTFGCISHIRKTVDPHQARG